MNIKQVQKDKKKIRRDFNFNVKIMINSKKVTLDETERYLLFCIKKPYAMRMVQCGFTAVLKNCISSANTLTSQALCCLICAYMRNLYIKQKSV